MKFFPIEEKKEFHRVSLKSFLLSMKVCYDLHMKYGMGFDEREVDGYFEFK